MFLYKTDCANVAGNTPLNGYFPITDGVLTGKVFPNKQSLLFLAFSRGSVFLRTVPTAGLTTTVNARCVQCSTNDLITNTRKITNTTASNENDGVFLKFVTFAGNIDRYLFPVGKTNTGDFPECGVRFLRLHCSDQKTNTSFLSASFQNRGLSVTSLLFSVFTNQLIDCWHGRIPILLTFDKPLFFTTSFS